MSNTFLFLFSRGAKSKKKRDKAETKGRQNAFYFSLFIFIFWVFLSFLFIFFSTFLVFTLPFFSQTETIPLFFFFYETLFSFLISFLIPWKGVLDHSVLPTIWANFPPQIHQNLISLLTRFGVIHPIISSKFFSFFFLFFARTKPLPQVNFVFSCFCSLLLTSLLLFSLFSFLLLFFICFLGQGSSFVPCLFPKQPSDEFTAKRVIFFSVDELGYHSNRKVVIRRIEREYRFGFLALGKNKQKKEQTSLLFCFPFCNFLSSFLFLSFLYLFLVHSGKE